MRIEELKDILASRSGVYGENIALSDMYGVLEDYDALCAELAERDEQHRRIMAEECAPDERHCTCVPALRAEVARLRGLLGRAAQESCDHVLGRYAAQTDAKDGDAWICLNS